MTHTIRWISPAISSCGQPFMTMLDRDGFYYARRAGVDSVAFLLKDGDKWGLLKCRQGATGKVANRSFTGSWDNPELKLDETVVVEVKEEAGYDVTLDRVRRVGAFEVGHMTDEAVHLFVVDVTGLIPGPVSWVGLEERDLLGTVWDQTVSPDWKAVMIMTYVELHDLQERLNNLL